MTKEEKEILIIFGNKETLNFMCKQVFPELENILKDSSVLSKSLRSEKVRLKAHFRAVIAIKIMLMENAPLYNELQKLYYNLPINKIIDDILIAYTYYLAKLKDKNINVFTDKMSVVYSGINYFEII